MRELRAGKENAEVQLRALNTSIRATKVAELQSEASMVQEEMERLTKINSVSTKCGAQRTVSVFA